VISNVRELDLRHLPPELAAQVLERHNCVEGSITDAERELLTILAEECGEVVQRCTKIQRFGMTENPWTGKHNRAELEAELGDVIAMMRILAARGTIRGEIVAMRGDKKIAALRVPDGRLRVAVVPDEV
jgi:NTP pyrophosphatase (non-canonical NTP hydrolase)